MFDSCRQIADEYHENLDQHMSELFTQAATLSPTAGGIRPNPHSMPNMHTATRYQTIRDEGGLAGLTSPQAHETTTSGTGSAKARIQV